MELYHNYQIYLDFTHTLNFTKSVWLSLDVYKNIDRMANNVDPDQTRSNFIRVYSCLLRHTSPNIYQLFYLSKTGKKFLGFTRKKIARFHQEKNC